MIGKYNLSKTTEEAHSLIFTSVCREEETFQNNRSVWEGEDNKHGPNSNKIVREVGTVEHWPFAVSQLSVNPAYLSMLE